MTDDNLPARAPPSPTLPCPACGGRLTLTPETHTIRRVWLCTYCGYSEPIPGTERGSELW